MTYQLCTRELKRHAMQSYSESIGWRGGTYETAIGIRADETRRVNPTVAQAEGLIYPLINLKPTTKEDVLSYFEDFDWDLQIPEHLGNCLGCFKKSDRKLLQVWRDDPSAFNLPLRLEGAYSGVGSNNVPGPRKLYRGYRSTSDLIQGFVEAGGDYQPSTHDGGCTEQCDLYPTE